ncbi:MAG: DNA-processing protein DprA [Pseudomonadota bacterium]
MTIDATSWIALKAVAGLGNLLFRRLLERFGSPEAIMQAAEPALAAVAGISPAMARRIRAADPESPEARKEMARTRDAGFHIVTAADESYPELLRQIPDPPPYLYVVGDLIPDAVGIAMVGSRNATRYGREVAAGLASDLAGMGLTVISGMAAGIDTAAHRGAIDGGGRTVAVLGCGLNRIYPAQNKKLYQDIAAHGAVVSEFAMDADPDARHFPKRNRVISGMSLGTIVVEATLRSGSLITARMALEQNREVFAVPGSVHSFKSTGSHHLIRQGAKLVEHARHVLEELNLSPDGIEPTAPDPAAAAIDISSLSETERRLVGALEAYPVHADSLCRRLSMAAGDVAGILIQLELKGVVQQMPGNQYILAPAVRR